MRTGKSAGSRGFTYLWLLFVVALGGVALAALGQRQQTIQQREREAELRFRGEAIAAAIGGYLRASPGAEGANGLPQRLEDLLEDRRSGKVQRHLRRLYTDPFTGRADWLLIQGEVAVKPPVQDGSTDESEKLVHQKPASAAASAALGTPLMSGIVGVSSRSQALLLASGAVASVAAASSPAVAPKTAKAPKPRVSELRFMVAADAADASE